MYTDEADKDADDERHQAGLLDQSVERPAVASASTASRLFNQSPNQSPFNQSQLNQSQFNQPLLDKSKHSSSLIVDTSAAASSASLACDPLDDQRMDLPAACSLHADDNDEVVGADAEDDEAATAAAPGASAIAAAPGASAIAAAPGASAIAAAPCASAAVNAAKDYRPLIADRAS